jgi:site-specific recombinase XerD
VFRNILAGILFRHSFSTTLIANGENVKVVQELMRHSNCRCTLEIYSQAKTQAKRDAQQRLVQMIFPHDQGSADPARIRLPLS